MVTLKQVALAPREVLEKWHELATEGMMANASGANTNFMHNACLHAIHLINAEIENRDHHQIED
jgi:hypothetical protein